MRGILVFNDINDVLYIYTDNFLKTHINERAFEAGLISENEKDQPVNPNVVMQLFSPLVASQRFMISQMSNPYHSIECGDGLLFVFEQYHDLIQVAINGDGSESKDFLHRKLLVFQRLLNFLFGPVHEELKPDRAQECRVRWLFLTQLLNTWCHLYNEEQGFLIEAVERLYVNQVLNTKCIELLESAMVAMKAVGEKGVLHAMLIANAKLLAFYSSRNAGDLQASDILLMILLVKAIFPNSQKLEDLFSQSYSASQDESQLTGALLRLDLDHYESASSGQDSEEVEHFRTPRSSPNITKEIKDPGMTQSATDISVTDQTTIDISADQSTMIGGFAGVSSFHKSNSETPGGPGRGRVVSDSSFHSSPPDDLASERETYQKFTVLLGTAACRYTPHTLHCVEVLPGIVLLLVCEVSRAKNVWALCQILTTIRALASQSRQEISHNRPLVEAIEANFKKIHDVIKKLKGPSSVERTFLNCIEQWEQVRKNGLSTHLKQGRRSELTPRLESCLNSLLHSLKALFRRMYLTPWYVPPETQHALQQTIENIHQNILHSLSDYKDYLDVKAQRNITITSIYVEDFPGLVHFVYVDRMSHQMLAPSINISDQLEEGNNTLMTKVKEKIWKEYLDIQSQLRQGRFWQSTHHGDLLFSYYLWFEDTSGNALQLQQPFRGCPDNVMPGILAGNFYRQIIKQCLPALQNRPIRCYELLTVHIGILPNQFVLNHCRKLAQQLWEIGESHYSPISLL